MKFNANSEKSPAAWGWRALLGPAMVVDGLLSSLTVGTVSLGASLAVSRRLALARINHIKKTA